MIDVALTPAGLRPADVIVVIDVLRATSTLARGLDAGYRQVHCVATLDDARDLAGPGRVLAGERGCRRPPGFDQGNSPREAGERRGEELVLASTNGTPAIVAATGAAPIVLAAAVLNLEAVACALEETLGAGGAVVQLVCAGTDGAPALEDVYLAGRLCHRLGGGPQTDAATVARSVARWHPDPYGALRCADHAQRLRAAGLEADIFECARESVLGVVPYAGASGAASAVMRAGPPAAHAGRARGAQPVSARDAARTGAERILGRTLAPRPEVGEHLGYLADTVGPALEASG